MSSPFSVERGRPRRGGRHRRRLLRAGRASRRSSCRRRRRSRRGSCRRSRCRRSRSTGSSSCSRRRPPSRRRRRPRPRSASTTPLPHANGSSVQVAEQPSLPTVLPSSHSSVPCVLPVAADDDGAVRVAASGPDRTADRTPRPDRGCRRRTRDATHGFASVDVRSGRGGAGPRGRAAPCSAPCPRPSSRRYAARQSIRPSSVARFPGGESDGAEVRQVGEAETLRSAGMFAASSARQPRWMPWSASSPPRRSSRARASQRASPAATQAGSRLAGSRPRRAGGTTRFAAMQACSSACFVFA